MSESSSVSGRPEQLAPEGPTLALTEAAADRLQDQTAQASPTDQVDPGTQPVEAETAVPAAALVTADSRKSLRNRIPLRAVASVLALGAVTSVAAVGYSRQQGDIESLRQEQSNNSAQSERQLDSLAVRMEAQQAQINRMATYGSALTGVESRAFRGEGIRDVADLPGYGHEVGLDDAALLRNATVKIIRKYKEAGSEYGESCTGTLVTSRGVRYVLTAAHCFTANSGKGGDLVGTDAVSVLPGLPYDYAVTTPAAYLAQSSGKENRIPMSKITAVSAAYDSDLALVRFEDSPSQKALDGQSSAQTFEDLGSLNPVPLADRFASIIPEPGEAAKLFGIPSAADGKLLEDDGVYLGRSINPYRPGQYLDIVAVSAESRNEDVCNYGASGSSSVLASNFTLWPLSLRLSRGYEGDDVGNAPDNYVSQTQKRLKIVASLGVDAIGYNVLCGYAVSTPSTITDLLAGFDRP